jgi:methylmalonyl-CoA mutase
MAKSKPLLEEFPPVATEAWEEAIRKDLKGADYAKKLLWKTEDGLTLKPYYRSDALAGIDYLDLAPGEFPYVRGVTPANVWRIREEIEAADADSANERARKALAAGAEEISFHAPVPGLPALETLLAGIDTVPVHFESAGESLVSLLLQARRPARGSTAWNPFSNLSKAAEWVRQSWPGFRPMMLPGTSFEEAGATTVQEIGYTLASGIDFLAAMQAQAVGTDQAAAAVAFSLAIGANYFFQIAKLRAFRLLWARAVTTFGGSPAAAKTEIHARTSRWNQSIYDPHVNVLRGTTEAMSAAIGGANSIAVAPFDETYQPPSDAARRLARNTQIILKKEAQLDRVADPGGGSYYVEFLTHSIAREAWRVMQQIEAAGGYRQAQGLIREELEKSRAAREVAVALRRRVFVGTNQYPNLSETAQDKFHPNAPEPGTLGTLLQTPLAGDANLRGPAAFEQIRLRTERDAAAAGRRKRILLAEIGDPKMRAARSNFAANFFGCAGFEIVIASYEDVGQIAVAEADAIVVCSSDPEYPALCPALLAKLRQAGRSTPLIVAGNPADSIEQLKQAGVADFIHVRSNAVETLTAWQKRLGIAA